MRKIVLLIFFIALIQNVVADTLILSQNQNNEFEKVYTTNGSYNIDRYSDYPVLSSNNSLNGEMFYFGPEIKEVNSLSMFFSPLCNGYFENCDDSESSYVNRYINIAVYTSILSTPSNGALCLLFGLYCSETTMYLQKSFTVNTYPGRNINFQLDYPIVVNNGKYVWVQLTPIYTNVSHKSYVQFERYIDWTNLITNPNITFSEVQEITADTGGCWIFLCDTWTSQEAHLTPSYKKYLKISFFGNYNFPQTPIPTPIPTGTPQGPPELPGEGLPGSTPDTNFTIPEYNNTKCTNATDVNNSDCIPQKVPGPGEIPSDTGGSKTLKVLGYCTTDECTMADIVDLAYDISISSLLLSFGVLLYKGYTIRKR